MKIYIKRIGIVLGMAAMLLMASIAMGDVETSSTPDLKYTRECCIEDLYYVDWYTSEQYFQLPISVEVWDKKLKPAKGVEVQVQVYAEDISENQILKSDQTKKTKKNGIAKFGYYETSNEYGDSNRIVKIWIDQGNGNQTYMEKKFAIKWD